ncbi:RNA polymerase sigma factor [Mesonia sp. MT50]|uniref:RNA polymerase sigma factor n=1 Tax=Mesonia profundi TaxID=3070998 RepID=A0ABU1A5I7_9FLAO|nr:RNA polymerase sigma factor [Mesonia profundi]MDQ7918249.1 RNA polymerase sigma factor [Mesonia profundi]
MKIISLHNNEKKLIQRAAKNNRLAQQTLYEIHAPKMLSVCRMYIKDLHFAEDVMLKGFFKVFKNLDGFQHKGSFEGWVRRIMVREAIDFLRRKKEIQFSDRMEQYDAALDTDDYASAEAIQHLQELIDELPEGYKMVFVMYAVEGYKHQEIAELLHISEGTSKSQLFKARKVLQEKLANQKEENHG